MAEPELDEEEALLLLASALPAVEPPVASRSRLLAELRGPSRFAPFADEVAKVFAAPIEAVLTAFARIDDESAWLGPPTGLAHMLPIHGRVVLSRLKRGLRIPKHAHQTRELTYVLSGLLVADGVEHRAGACMDMAPGTEHALEVAGERDCFAVFAEDIPRALG
jgi:hypothetical protein